VFTVLNVTAAGTIVIQNPTDGTTQTVSANQLIVVSS
jgi:hypothetical protein